MKILIPIAIIIALISAVILVQKFNTGFSSKAEPKKTDTIEQPSREEMQSISEQNTDKITFTYKESDKVISTKDNPYVSPSEDYRKDTLSQEGFVVDAKDGVALIQDTPTTYKYIVTDTARTNHKLASLEGYTTNPFILYADCTESIESDPYSRLDGLYVGKTISYGYITEANPSRVTIKRNDGGKTIITFGVMSKVKQEATAEEQPATPVSDIVEPPAVPNKVEVSSDTSTRG